MYDTYELAAVASRQPRINTDNTDNTDNKDIIVSQTYAKHERTHSELTGDPLEGRCQSAFDIEKAEDASPVIPPKWNYLKLDLFDVTPPDLQHLDGERKLKLNMCAYNHSSKRFNMVAMVTKEWWRLTQNMDRTTRDGRDHLAKCKAMRDQLHAEGCTGIRSSKVLMRAAKGKGNTVHNLSVLLAPLERDHEFVCVLIFGTDEYVFMLNGGKGALTEAQRKAQIVATWESRTQGKVRLTAATAFE